MTASSAVPPWESTTLDGLRLDAVAETSRRAAERLSPLRTLAGRSSRNEEVRALPGVLGCALPLAQDVHSWLPFTWPEFILRFWYLRRTQSTKSETNT